MLTTDAILAAHAHMMTAPSAAAMGALHQALVEGTGLRYPAELAQAIRQQLDRPPPADAVASAPVAKSTFVAGRECLRAWVPLMAGTFFAHSARIAAAFGEKGGVRTSIRPAIVAFEAVGVAGVELRGLLDLLVEIDEARGAPIEALLVRYRALGDDASPEDLRRASDLAAAQPDAPGAATAAILRQLMHRAFGEPAPLLDALLEELAARIARRQAATDLDLVPYATIAATLWDNGEHARALEVLESGVSVSFAAPPANPNAHPSAPFYFSVTHARIQLLCDLAGKLAATGRGHEALPHVDAAARLASTLAAADEHRSLVRAHLERLRAEG